MPGFIKYLAITAALAFLMAALPAFTLMIAVFWGAALILAAAYLGGKQLTAILLLNLILLYLVADASGLLYFSSFFGIAVLVMSLLINQGQDYYQVQKWGIAAAVIGVSMFILMIYSTTGQTGTVEMEKQLNLYLQETMEEFEQAGMIELYENQGISRAELQNAFTQMVKTVTRHLPAIYYLQAILATFFMLFLASVLCRKGGLERLKRRPYEKEIMPWQLVWVVIAGLALWLWGRSELNSLYYAGSNILVVMVPVSVYFGLAAVIFKLKQQKPAYRKWGIILLITLSVLFLPSAVIFFGVLGVFDSLLDYRKLRMEKGEG